jgi:hypothetical protein
MVRPLVCAPVLCAPLPLPLRHSLPPCGTCHQHPAMAVRTPPLHAASSLPEAHDVMCRFGMISCTFAEGCSQNDVHPEPARPHKVRADYQLRDKPRPLHVHFGLDGTTPHCSAAPLLATHSRPRPLSIQQRRTQPHADAALHLTEGSAQQCATMRAANKAHAICQHALCTACLDAARRTQSRRLCGLLHRCGCNVCARACLRAGGRARMFWLVWTGRCLHGSPCGAGGAQVGRTGCAGGVPAGPSRH